MMDLTLSVSDSSLVSHEIFDLNVLTQHFGDDHDFKIVFLNLAIKELINARQFIELYRENNVNHDIKEFLHKLKGTVSTIGFMNLAQDISHIENKLETNLNIKISLEDIDNQLERALLQINNILD